MCLTLSSCGATGRLLGNVTMIPVKAAGTVVRAATYQDGTEALPTDISAYGMGESVQLHHLD